MSKQVIIDLPDNLYERFQQISLAEREDIIHEVLRVLDEALSPVPSDQGGHDWSEPDEAVEREKEAYIALHPQFKAKYLGKHIAIYGGQLVDMDDNFSLLYARIEAKYPDVFVWLTQVREEPIQTLVFRSPRLLSRLQP